MFRFQTQTSRDANGAPPSANLHKTSNTLIEQTASAYSLKPDIAQHFLGVTTLGGFVKITSIGRSWEKEPVVAAAPAHLDRTAIEIRTISTTQRCQRASSPISGAGLFA
jgi:hypothetical protein